MLRALADWVIANQLGYTETGIIEYRLFGSASTI
jgi:hypothetical protein